MEVLQHVLASLLGLWSLYFLIRKFVVKNNPATQKSCGKECGC
jgi:hypothetical protein